MEQVSGNTAEATPILPRKVHITSPTGRRPLQSSRQSHHSGGWRLLHHWWPSWDTDSLSFQSAFLQREHGLSVEGSRPAIRRAAVCVGGSRHLPRWLYHRARDCALPYGDGLGAGSGYRHGGACLRGGLFRRGSDMGFLALGYWCGFATPAIWVRSTTSARVVSNRSRATAIAVLLILVSLIGNGVGPYFVGFMSDFFMQQQLMALEPSTWLSPEACKSGTSCARRRVALPSRQFCGT